MIFDETSISISYTITDIEMLTKIAILYSNIEVI